MRVSPEKSPEPAPKVVVRTLGRKRYGNQHVWNRDLDIESWIVMEFRVAIYDRGRVKANHRGRFSGVLRFTRGFAKSKIG